jgi:hypothetical protein
MPSVWKIPAPVKVKDLLPGSAVEDIGRSRKTGYKPSADDVKDFQLALQQEVAKLGY